MCSSYISTKFTSQEAHFEQSNEAYSFLPINTDPISTFEIALPPPPKRTFNTPTHPITYACAPPLLLQILPDV
jgi:hypothetical protein